MTERDVKKLFKEEARINKYKFKGDFAFKSINNFFYAIEFWCIKEKKTQNYKIELEFGFKPMVVDDFFWDILGFHENKEEPLSLRATGAFVLGLKNIAVKNIDCEEVNLHQLIKDNLQEIEEGVKQISQNINNLMDFIDYIETNQNDQYEWGDVNLLITANIALNNDSKALELSEYAIKNKKGGSSWSIRNKNFYEHTIDYIKNKREHNNSL